MPMIVPPLVNPTINGVDVGETSTLVVAANADRRYLVVVNDSNSVIYLALGTAAVLNKGIRLNLSGGWYEMLDQVNLYTGAVYAICAFAAQRLTYLEA